MYLKHIVLFLTIIFVIPLECKAGGEYRRAKRNLNLLDSAIEALKASIVIEHEQMPNEKLYDDIIRSACLRHASLEFPLIKGIIKAESNYDPRAVSPKGAVGIMQILPDLAVSEEIEKHELFDPKKNIDFGCRYFSYLLERYNYNKILALAAYNAGPGAVDRYGAVPPYKETQAYVTKVLIYYNQYKRLE